MRAKELRGFTVELFVLCLQQCPANLEGGNMELDKIRVTSHPSYKVFRSKNIPIANVARAINRSYGYTANILTGIRTATPEIDSQLKELASKLLRRRRNGGVVDGH